MRYQHSFLRRHIAHQLTSVGRQELLAVEHLLRQIERCRASDADDTPVDRHHSIVRRLVNTRQFFYRRGPDRQLYFPVQVQPYYGHGHHGHQTDWQVLGWTSGRPLRPYDDLTELIQQMDARWRADGNSDTRGIVLLSRSGAGKTAACWKAFYDCLYSMPHDAHADGLERAGECPRLGQFLPCWLPLDRRHSEEKTSEDLLQHLLSMAALPEHARGKFEHWLTTGPPLLIFADLNRAEERHQLIFAQALHDFQATWGLYGHRCVITFRSTRYDSGPMAMLASKHDLHFGFYDLVPLPVEQAVQYLSNLRRFEQELAAAKLNGAAIEFDQHRAAAAARKPLAEIVEDQCRSFSRLAQSGSTIRSKSEESVISTPLLMHLFTVLSPGTLQEDATLSELYGAVVDQHLENDFVTYATQFSTAGLVGNRGKLRIRTAMTRLALAIQASGIDQTSLTVEDWLQLMQRPERRADDARRSLPGGRVTWRPQKDYWLNSNPVYSDSFSDEELNGLLEFGMFRRTATSDDGDRIGLLHDSFIYYLAANALVEYEEPGYDDVPDNGWWRATVRRIGNAPQLWQRAAPFLAGRLIQLDRKYALHQQGTRLSALDRLVCVCLKQADHPDWVRFLVRFCDGDDDDPLLSEVARALVNNAGATDAFASDLRAIVQGWLRCISTPDPRLHQLLQCLEVN